MQESTFILTSFLFVATLVFVSSIGFSASFLADPSDTLLTASAGIDRGTTDSDVRHPRDPDAGNRPDILDWNGAGRDFSRHRQGAGHEAKLCGICG